MLSATLPGLELLRVSPALLVESQGQWTDSSNRFVPEGTGNVAQDEAAGGGNLVQLQELPLQLRIAYLIPANRTPQTEGVKNLQNVARWYQEFLRDQMDRYGYGSRTVAFETESDAVTPKVHVLTMPNSDDYYRADDQQNAGLTIYNRVLEGAAAVGIPPFVEGELWLYVHEAHTQLPDGSVVGRVALGAGSGNGYSGGVGVVAASMLSFADPEGMADERPYHGLVVPQIGPHPLEQDVSFPWFEGQTISSVVSSQVGAALHEVTHGLGIGHEFRNDVNAHGSLMGNGLRGFRSFVWPEQFPNDYVRLGPAEALGLRFSRYLNVSQTVTDTVAPAIGSFTADPQPQAGLLQVSFMATDNSALGAALLSRSGDGYVAEAPLSGTAASLTLQIPDYEPGQSNSFDLTIIDAQGNRRRQTLTATPNAPTNRAPQPFIKASSYALQRDQPVTLDASGSSDPDHAAAQLLVEWDLNGDGTFDTPPTTAKTLTTSFTAGIAKIYARITDPSSASSVSAPITVRIATPWHNASRPLDVNDDTHVVAGDALDVINDINAFRSRAVPPDSPIGPPFYDVTGDNYVAPDDALAVINYINAFGPDGLGQPAQQVVATTADEPADGAIPDLLHAPTPDSSVPRQPQSLDFLMARPRSSAITAVSPRDQGPPRDESKFKRIKAQSHPKLATENPSDSQPTEIDTALLGLLATTARRTPRRG